MKIRSSIILSLVVAMTLSLFVLPVSVFAAGNTWTVNPALADDSNCSGSGGRQCKTIQAAITAATAGDTINVLAGTFIENIIVDKALTLAGAGQGLSFVKPAMSAPNPCSDSSLCGGAASNIILVQANDVTIYGFTLDGDNPALTSGVVKGGADLDARNGIITNHPLGVYNNLTVYATTIKNIYLRGIYASSGGTFNFHHLTAQNVQADSQSIALFNFGGSGSFSFNTVSDANDAIASNWSRGTQYLHNTVTSSGSGVHSDNNGGYGGTPDLLAYNTVSNCSPNGYGVWVFAPFLPARVEGNTITNCAVGLTASGHNGAVPVTVTFTNNKVDGAGLAGSTGVYVTTSEFGWGDQDVAAVFTGNTIINNCDGFFIEETGGKSTSVQANSNNISGNSTHGAWNQGTTNADFASNWWGSEAGPGSGGNNGATGPVTTTPFAVALASSTTASTHEVGETGTLDTHVTVNGMYGAQLRVSHDNSVLNFTSGVRNNVLAATPPWAWDFVPEDFVPVTGGRRVSGSMSADPLYNHTVGANLTGQSIATWNYTCAAPGTSSLTYDTSADTGSYLADINGFAIPAAFTGDSITCLVATASIDGYIKLQGRLGTNPVDASWVGSKVTLTCVALSGCDGFGPYTMTTDTSGRYQWLKTAPGSGVMPGTYVATVQRRAYLGATKASNVVVVAGANTINLFGTAPTLWGGDVIESQKIDIFDLAAIGNSFGTPVIPADTGTDVNGDGFVNIFDLVMAGGNFDKTTSVWTP